MPHACDEDNGFLSTSLDTFDEHISSAIYHSPILSLQTHEKDWTEMAKKKKKTIATRKSLWMSEATLGLMDLPIPIPIPVWCWAWIYTKPTLISPPEASVV